MGSEQQTWIFWALRNPAPLCIVEKGHGGTGQLWFRLKISSDVSRKAAHGPLRREQWGPEVYRVSHLEVNEISTVQMKCMKCIIITLIKDALMNISSGSTILGWIQGRGLLASAVFSLTKPGCGGLFPVFPWMTWIFCMCHFWMFSSFCFVLLFWDREKW